MTTFIRLLANIFFAFIISFVFADFAYFGFNFLKSSPINASICMFVGCFISSLLVCELFSISKESNKTNRKIKKTRLTRIAKKIAQEKALAYAEQISQEQSSQGEIRNSINNMPLNMDISDKNNSQIQNKLSYTSIENKDIISKNNNKILIKNLPFNVSKSEINSLFLNEYTVKTIEISRNKNRNKRKKHFETSIATVTLENSCDETILLKISGQKIRNQIIVASFVN